MPQVIERTVFAFDELSDEAKERARNWYRDGQLDYDWFDSTYEDADTIAKILGIEIDRKRRNNPKAPAEPAIWFSGFSSQGDGACFEGRYSYAKGAAKRIREYAPRDTELHRIADELQAIQRRNFYRASLSVRHSGHYYHSGCMECTRLDDCAVSDEGPLFQCMRDFADWIYRQLEKECEWLQADEQVDESIRANEYRFDEAGRIA